MFAVSDSYKLFIYINYLLIDYNLLPSFLNTFFHLSYLSLLLLLSLLHSSYSSPSSHSFTPLTPSLLLLPFYSLLIYLPSFLLTSPTLSIFPPHTPHTPPSSSPSPTLFSPHHPPHPPHLFSYLPSFLSFHFFIQPSSLISPLLLSSPTLFSPLTPHTLPLPTLSGTI
jgi:hypothetical protein